MGPRKPPEPDHELFHRVMASVDPLPEQSRGVGAVMPAAGKNNPEPSKTAKKTIANKITRPKIILSEKEPQVQNQAINPGMDKRQAHRFRRGRLAIEATLDLHGDTQAVAHDRLRRFIRDCHGRGLRCVLIITGKGMALGNGENPDYGQDYVNDFSLQRPQTGVLRRNLPLWLAAGDLAPMILSEAPAQPRDGGGGAFYVLLRRRRLRLEKPEPGTLA